MSVKQLLMGAHYCENVGVKYHETVVHPPVCCPAHTDDRPIMKETVAYYVYWFSGEERECIGSADTRKDAWAIARKWIGETFPKLDLYYIRRWEPEEHITRYDFGSWSTFIDIVEVKIEDE